MTSVERLILEHEALEAIALRLEDQVRKREPNLALVLALRAQLSVELSNHLTGEDETLYPRLAAANDASLAEAAGTFGCELETLRADWNAYLDEWCSDAIESDWTSFAEETLALMSRLRSRIARENACLIPATLQRSMVRLRTAA